MTRPISGALIPPTPNATAPLSNGPLLRRARTDWSWARVPGSGAGLESLAVAQASTAVAGQSRSPTQTPDQKRGDEDDGGMFHPVPSVDDVTPPDFMQTV